jgi:hypothetical protein
MNLIDWTCSGESRLDYSYARFAQAKSFVFERWCELASERALARPDDLSGSCKFGSLFMRYVFGGAIRGHFEHQFNLIDGRIVDLSHDARDVGRMTHPYLHEQAFFAVPEVQASLSGCSPRAERWGLDFIRTHA